MRKIPSQSGVGGGQVRLSGPIFVLVENWRRSQPSRIPSRSQAVLRLLKQALGEPEHRTITSGTGAIAALQRGEPDRGRQETADDRASAEAKPTGLRPRPSGAGIPC
jgi:hypothetical protein